MTDPFRRTDETEVFPSEEQRAAIAAASVAPDGFKHPDRCPGCNASLLLEGVTVVKGVICPHCGYDLESMPKGMGAGQHEAHRRQ